MESPERKAYNNLIILNEIDERCLLGNIFVKIIQLAIMFSGANKELGNSVFKDSNCPLYRKIGNNGHRRTMGRST